MSTNNINTNNMITNNMNLNHILSSKGLNMSE
jgi:hypothetical protein